jgi:pimeloyl-ACP methyl ester carboxylesterase
MKAVWRELGDFYEPVYFYDGQSASVMDDIRHRAHVGDELDDRVAAHTAALEADPAFYLPVTDLLVGLSQPMLVIRGASDPVCTDAQLAVMRTHVGADRVVTLDQSGHFPYVEQPARYASLVTEFVQDR